MTENLKYPRTRHLPDSPGATSDDKWLSPAGLAFLRDPANAVVVTEKMDGSNFTMTRSTCFGRSVDAHTNHWDSIVKQLWSGVRFDIPEGWRLSGENMYARKSVSYENLPGPFILFGVWDENDTLLSWDDTKEVAEMLNLPHAPELYTGSSFEEAVSVWARTHNTDSSEGFVVRSVDPIPAVLFSSRVAKWVRADHVRTADDWRRRDDYAVNTFV